MVIYDLIKTQSDKIKHICINVNQYMNLLGRDEISNLLEIMTHRDIIRAGHYATLLGVNIWCSAEIPVNGIKISDKEIVSTKVSSNWSPILFLDNSVDMERILKMKAFW